MEKVLVVDDSPLFRKILKAALEKAGYQVLTAENGQQAIDILGQSDSPDLILLDRIMPDMDGIEVCRWVRQHICRQDGPSYKYFIILTAKNDQADVLEGFAQGADDYVRKPFCNEELIARVAVGSRMLQMQRQLWETAIRDPLTGLYNRRALSDLLAAELTRARRTDGRVAVAMVDVDHFKKINDNYGHDIGDEAIVAIGDRLRAALRGFELIGRVGGEEFILAFACGGDDDALAIADRVRRAIAAQPFVCGGQDLHLTVSIGLVTVAGDAEAAAAVRQADKALFMAKDGGRNRIALHQAAPDN